MRIIHLVNQCDRGGNVHVPVDLACMQSINGHAVVYASAGGRFEDLLERHGVRHERVPQNFRHALVAARGAGRLLALCRRFKPDILHAHMMSGAIHGYLASRAVGIPLVTTVHNSFDWHSWLMRLGDHVVAVSRSERDRLLAQGYRASRLHVVLNGTIGTPRAELNSSSGGATLRRPCVTTVCGLEARKGVHDLITAFRLCRVAGSTWHLYIAGDGPQREALERQAAEYGLTERVHFLGYVDNPAAIFSSTDIFVLASHADPCALTISEARHAGCAVIGTSVGGTPEQLEHGRAGRLVEPGKPSELARALTVLMTDHDALVAAKEAARRDLQYFQADRVFSDYLEIYKIAIASRRHVRSDGKPSASFPSRAT
jgi:glycosyltransferase involved in cell wall biosynthesis